jgi:hypothetical protein
MITNHIYEKAFKAGLPGFAVHPGVGTTPNAQVNANLSTLRESSIKTEGNHLTKSLTNFLAHVSKERSYNSSFLNSTSIDSQAATTAFVKALQNMTDFSLQNVDYTRVGNGFFANSSSYLSFQNVQSNNILQDALLNIADQIDEDPSAFSSLESLAQRVLQSYNGGFKVEVQKLLHDVA